MRDERAEAAKAERQRAARKRKRLREAREVRKINMPLGQSKENMWIRLKKERLTCLEIQREAKKEREKQKAQEKLREMEERRREIERKRDAAYQKELKEKKRKNKGKPTTSGLKQKDVQRKDDLGNTPAPKRQERTQGDKEMDKIPSIRRKPKGGVIKVVRRKTPDPGRKNEAKEAEKGK